MSPSDTSIAGLFRVALAGVVLTASAGAAMGLDIRHGPKAVVELFTSQGCSSCPPADAFLAQLGESEDTVTLAYHVDYWDYVGWEDTFALPANGELQRAYAQAWGKGRIFTPQIVLNGRQGMPGTQPDQITAQLGSMDLPVALSVSAPSSEVIEVNAQGDGRRTEDAVVWLVAFRSAADVTIERGENSGRELTYTHIVTNRQAVGMWSPQDGVSMRMPLAEMMGQQADGAAILIQERNGDLPGPIIGAAVVVR